MADMHLEADHGQGGGCSSGGSCGCSSTGDSQSGDGLIQLNVGMVKAEKTKPVIEDLPFQPTDKHPQGLLIGLDVGSTTVKFVVVDPITDEILHQDYQRHDTKQPEKCIEMLREIEQKFADVPRNAFRTFMTGSGGASIGSRIGAKFVQEVNAVSLAVEKYYPDVQSVVELGGQDAKIIIFKEDEETGKKKKIPSMNDKCAGGTGAVIDKINAKLKIPAEELCNMGYVGLKLHPVAGKCGVFAETDINGLQKQGVPPDELMASLFESIIQQNLSVLTRGHTLRPQVLLLGGPNTYIKGMMDCWRHNIPVVWKERNVEVPDKPIEELITVPDNAQYFAAIGAVEFAKIELEDNPHQGIYRGIDELDWYVNVGRIEEKKSAGGAGLYKSEEELEAFKETYKKEPWVPKQFEAGATVRGFIGLDGGSTSTKGVLLDEDKNVIAKAYQLSKGNPIEDTMEIIAAIQKQIEDQGCKLEVLGVGTTGYAKDILKDVIKADVGLVETVAHTQAGLHFYPGTDVIIDVGGQDIKLIILKNGQVKDFKLNTQCSAGNGYFLQSTAQGFGYKVEEFADIAFSAKAMPSFGYGCAVFMQSDIVDFQRQGWAPEEIMAGLCDVLPKNIWLYVSQIPNLAKLGKKFILQGGTQHNLAAVKSQADFIKSRFVGTGVEPEVIVHKFCGEAGAIGCAVEAHRLYTENGHRTEFIGLDRVQQIEYRTTRNENTRCYFCKNKCLRTFIDVKTGEEQAEPSPSEASVEAPGTRVSLTSQIVKSGPEAPRPARMKKGPDQGQQEVAQETLKNASTKSKSKVPLETDEQRLIIATCEKGTVEDVSDMREIKKGLDEVKKANPNFAEIFATQVFRPTGVNDVSDPIPKVSFKNFLKRTEVEKRIALMENRKNIRIGMPRALNMYSMGPWFMAYFEALGLAKANLIWSDYTSEELYKEGAKRGAIDPCFPSKIGIPHVHNLLYHKHGEKKPLNYIFFPMIDCLPTFLEGVLDTRSCPTVAATPEAVKAAFIKEGDVFAEFGIEFLNTFVNFSEPSFLARQMFNEFADKLGLSQEENLRACRVAWDYYDEFHQKHCDDARKLLDRLEANDEIGVVLLTRPYHNDPGVCHEIPDEFQKIGIPVFTMDTLPRDPDMLDRLFGEEVRQGEFASPLSIEDAWKNAYSENTNRKVWAAKYAARHPNLVALELSSFKCGHDAPIYTVIEEIIENSGTPYFCFKDIDENKPAGSIKIRIETIAYFLSRHREKLVRRREKMSDIEAKLATLETQLRERQTGHVEARTVVGI
ncbi:MAG: acyl-CoA dehydratase activase-related protein [Phycisphaerales bacterium]|nr:acyl-CoA dehydratase activase-related protein [Phycisphaerales bacterium]